MPALRETALRILCSPRNRKSPRFRSRSIALLGAVDAGEGDDLWCYRRSNEPAVNDTEFHDDHVLGMICEVVLRS